MEAQRFGVGERVKYKMDCPELDNPCYTVQKGATATVLLVVPGHGDCYLVRLDEAVPGYINEMSVTGRYLEPE